MMLMNIAETKTTPTVTFWLMRTATAFLSPRLSGRCGARTSRLFLPVTSSCGRWKCRHAALAGITGLAQSPPAVCLTVKSAELGGPGSG